MESQRLAISRFLVLHRTLPMGLHTSSREVYSFTAPVYEFLCNLSDAQIDRRANADGITPDDIRNLTDAGLLRSEDVDETAALKHLMCPSPDDYESLHVIPTLRCSLACDYCFVFSNKRTPPQVDMSVSVLRRGLDFFFEGNHNPCPLVTFYGGEPLLRPDIIFSAVDYIEGGLHRSIRKRVITNGTHLTSEVAAKLVAHSFEIGVSIDGSQVAHDMHRRFPNGSGSHDIIARNVTALTHAGIRWNALCTIGAHNVKDFPSHLAHVLSLGPSAIALNMPRTSAGSSSIQLRGGMGCLVDAYISALDMCYEREIPELHFLKLMQTIFDGPQSLRPCSGCGSQVALAPDGRIGPCQAYVAEGKFFREMPKTLHDLVSVDAFHEWSRASNLNSKECAACSLLPLCNDDCVMDRERQVGSLTRPSLWQCELRRRMCDYFLERCHTQRRLSFVR